MFLIFSDGMWGVADHCISGSRVHMYDVLLLVILSVSMPNEDLASICHVRTVPLVYLRGG